MVEVVLRTPPPVGQRLLCACRGMSPSKVQVTPEDTEQLMRSIASDHHSKRPSSRRRICLRLYGQARFRVLRPQGKGNYGMVLRMIPHKIFDARARPPDASRTSSAPARASSSSRGRPALASPHAGVDDQLINENEDGISSRRRIPSNIHEQRSASSPSAKSA